MKEEIQFVFYMLVYHRVVRVFYFFPCVSNALVATLFWYIAISSRELGIRNGQLHEKSSLIPLFSSHPSGFTRGNVRLWDMLLTRGTGTRLVHAQLIPPYVNSPFFPSLSSTRCSRYSPSVFVYTVIYYYRFITEN